MLTSSLKNPNPFPLKQLLVDKLFTFNFFIYLFSNILVSRSSPFKANKLGCVKFKHRFLHILYIQCTYQLSFLKTFHFQIYYIGFFICFFSFIEPYKF